MALTLLDVVQNILSAMNSDAVNSISDTVESTQVANIVRDVFEEIVDEHNLPNIRTRINLTASTDLTKPTHMRIEDGISGMDSIYYDVRNANTDPLDYRKIDQVLPGTFLERSFMLDSTDTANVLTVQDETGTKLLIRKDVAPTYFTTVDDKTLIFNAYKASLEDTLQASKTTAHVMARPTVTLSDTFVIPIPDNLRSLFINEAKSACFAIVKQAPNAKIEQSAKRLRWNNQDYKTRIRTQSLGSNLPYPDFGRRRP